MKARMVAIAQAWREDWRATREGTKVLVILLAVLLVAWAAIGIWFSMAFQF